MKFVYDTWDPLIFELSLAGADLVTEYDRAVEAMISTSLKKKYPDYE
jgi:fructose-1,6-bisphosphatase/inositol monophosphatase family enzyme